MALRRLRSFVQGIQKDRAKRQRQMLRSWNRKVLSQQLESRNMLAGPELLAIRPDAGALLRDGDTLNSPPGEFNLLFNGGANLNESTINANSVRLIRSGGDGTFGDGNEVAVALGYVGLVDPGDTSASNTQRIVLRPASSASHNAGSTSSQLPDDTYRIQIVGTGPNALTNLLNETYAGLLDAVTFRIDRGAQVVAVVPQPVTRGPGNALSQATNQVVVYFDEQRLNTSDATDPKYYRLVNTKTTLSTADDETLLPVNAAYIYDAATKRNDVTLTFAGAIPEGTYRLDVGRASATDSSNITSVNVGTLFTDSASITSGFAYNGFIGDQNGTSTSTTDKDRYNIALRAGAGLALNVSPHSSSLRLRARLLDSAATRSWMLSITPLCKRHLRQAPRSRCPHSRPQPPEISSSKSTVPMAAPALIKLMLR